MAYISAMLAAVPDANKDAYFDTARKMLPLWKEAGAIGYKECWGVDVPDGKLTSFPMAVKAEAGETVAIAYIEWTDKAVADAAFKAMETDERWQAAFADGMPFDGKRMIFGGFEVLIDGLD
ncbi:MULTISPECIES: DUF1428 domain-containing protein [unclassified Meridianimarinicoccus]|uniref:DUF1428 domain-containing protein n=1 Tax=unclassified Meridianimarinicoccus TaxID=2923344 RepID=UPI00186919E4|nr:DUF1428 domain-containing protein [Fluviibacterium sp. MJW13]